MIKVNIICKTCKKKFQVFPYRTKTAKFCSIKCSTTVFKKGHHTWLKGTKGLVKPNKGSFKKGIIVNPKTVFKMGHASWNKGKHPVYLQGKNHPRWKGGIKHQCGYIYIWSPKHPYKNKQGYVALHRLIMEEYLKEFIQPNYVVHHINGDKLDNRIENLLKCTKAEHSRIHNNFNK